MSTTNSNNTTSDKSTSWFTRARGPERRAKVSQLFLVVCLCATSTAVLALAVLLSTIVLNGISGVDIPFLTGPMSGSPEEQGFKIPLVGSIWLLAVCALSAVPLGVGTAVFLEEFKPKGGIAKLIHGLVQTNIRNLAGVPSIVYGLIGLTVFVRFLGIMGGPLTGNTMTEIQTIDGDVVIGQVLADPPPPTVLVSDVLGELPVQIETIDDELGAALKSTGKAAVTGTIAFNGYEFVVDTPVTGEMVIDAFDVETDAAFANPYDAQPFEAAIALPAGATLETQASRRLMTVERGTVVIPETEIAHFKNDIDTVRINGYKLTFSSGEMVVGRVMSMNDATITLRPKGADPREPGVEYARADITHVKAYKAFAIGDEDWPLYIRFPFGRSVLAGGLTLMLVVLPIVIIASQEAIRGVPGSLREGALALGATKWQAVRTQVLPNAAPGVLTGCILAMSRAIGETAPILVVGAASFIAATPSNLMSGYSAMPLQIYQWTVLPEASGFQPLAASGIVVLLVILLAMNGVAVALRQMLQKPLT